MNLVTKTQLEMKIHTVFILVVNLSGWCSTHTLLLICSSFSVGKMVIG